MIRLTSLQNPQVKQTLSLRNRRERDAAGLFLIEGYRELSRAVEAGWFIKKVFVCEELFLGKHEPALIERITANGGEAAACSAPLFAKLSYRDRPDGLLAVAPQRTSTLSEMETCRRGASQPPFYVIAEAIEKPGNLGTLLRSSDAAGISGLLVCDRCTDIFNPNVVRASVGTLFTVPFVETSGKEALTWLKNQGISIVAAMPEAPSLFTEVDLTRPIAIALGTEQLGLSRLWREEADLQVRIPMKGAADSLNVAMAATLLLYEVCRQRQSP